MNKLWKIAGVIIIGTVLVLGLLVPLNPGITDVSPFSHTTGISTKLRIKGYNTHFLKAQSTKAYLLVDAKHVIESLKMDVLSDTEANIYFSIPESLPLEAQVIDASLIINTDNDGAFTRPSAISITLNDPDKKNLTDGWMDASSLSFTKLDQFRFPYRNILVETIRNTYFHVPMWFSMVLLFLASAYQSVKYLRNPLIESDYKASSLVSVGILFGILGIITGALWAKYTWGAYWSWDVKQNMSVVCMLIYAAYFLLRQSITDQDRRARVSAVYNLFAFFAMIPLLFIIPRLTDSLHPGSGGNPALGGEDLDNTMRLIFYPAIIGWTLIGLWLAELRFRFIKLEQKIFTR